ncbi:MAG: DEAD/DEAH box helicase family protein [Sediminibacterium sp.]|nr:DEAD/DEAH box helicase family protein [Sediminibacterium sp.]
MELKSYQHKVIQDLELYLDYIQQYKKPDLAFNAYWENRVGIYNPIEGTGMQPYKNTIPNAAHVCVKVPTAGGKTFIACNAIYSIFNAYSDRIPKVVVWLVPWSNLLDQTVKNLSDPDHPYRQKLNSLFNNRVQVYEKKDLLQAANFNPSVVKDQLSIIVMSFSSLRARNKEDRKVYQENGQLSSFVSTYKNNNHLLEDTDETALINVIRSMHPLLVVDESHNAESNLSVDMLNAVNPSFVLDLTATPKENSNIVSIVPARELKKEHMVKLPVIVYNHPDKTEVINSALHLQRKLEILAIKQEKIGGKYIRPIVLFQAQPRIGDDNTTFEKLKEQLLKIGIPHEQIKIKTADTDELKGVDLASKDCPVRYIITINALKEGWDCPFAYVLASLADKSSAVDVEQILGRVLRQPYVMKHSDPLLNVSYVLTASSKFNETLDNIVRGLQGSGFSDKDYRPKDIMPDFVKQEEAKKPLSNFLFPEQINEVEEDEIEVDRIAFVPNEINEEQQNIAVVNGITELAIEQDLAMQKRLADDEANLDENQIFTELPSMAKQYKIIDQYQSIVGNLLFPQFYLLSNSGEIFDTDKILLNQESLLKNFKLSTEDIKIDFENLRTELYKADIEEISSDNYDTRLTKIEDPSLKDQIVEFILAKPKEAQINDITYQLANTIGILYPHAESEIRKYIKRVIENLDAEQLKDVLSNRFRYAEKIKEKIKQLAAAYAEKMFTDFLKVKKIIAEPTWRLPKSLVPGKLGSAISNSLYEREAEMNGFETDFIRNIAALPNIEFWHRNLSRGKGFSINGFNSNHYPDFIVYTKHNNIIIIETKGGDRDNSDSEAKCRLGHIWAERAGINYSYFMVFEKHEIKGAYNPDKAIELIRQL